MCLCYLNESMCWYMVCHNSRADASEKKKEGEGEVALGCLSLTCQGCQNGVCVCVCVCMCVCSRSIYSSIHCLVCV